ncbi:hypothetical protein EDF56_10768 [Novosphingobium sp. PhB165]|uniref:hypothetical protein n=1 Tax=Novosphingobium sp. PhB165 TaxID=2485105 RepID=UPI00104F7F4B|nr:hypothetical protein [Novosphingobium sp. PhB165]TCM16489.1 hypothetical protein EDF56_10768 [Novosphingobium sp. PhB165]
MINPYISVQAGVFAGLPGNLGVPSLASQICAMLARRIAEPPQGRGVLAPDWWSQAFNSIPLLSVTASGTSSISGAKPATLAALCLGVGVVSDIPTAQDKLAKWISGGAVPPSSLNSLAVTGTASLINLSLAFLDVPGGSVTRTDGTINIGTPANKQQLQSIFGTETPLSNEPYFCAL